MTRYLAIAARAAALLNKRWQGQSIAGAVVPTADPVGCPGAMHACTQGGLGPMAGQADWFLLFAPERNEMGITRYTDEVHRLFG